MSLRTLSWQLIRRHPWTYVGCAACILIFLVGRLVPGAVEQAVFDKLGGAGPAAFGIGQLIAFMVGFELARLTAQLGWAFTEITVRYRANARIQRSLMASILRRPGAAAMTDSPVAVLNRFRDDALDVATFITDPLILVGHLGFCILAVASMLKIDAEMTIVVVAPMLLVVVAATIAQRRVQRYRRESRTETARFTALLGAMFRAAEIVKISGANDDVVREIGVFARRRREASVRDAVFTQTLNSVFFNSADIAIGIVLVLAAGPIMDRSFTVGDFALFEYYLFFVSRLPSIVGGFIVSAQQSAVAAVRLGIVAQSADSARFVTSDRAPRRVPTATLCELSVVALSHRYPNADPLAPATGVEGVSLTLRPGEIVAITGNNGSGKTTLLRALLGLLDGSEGQVCWNGTLISDRGRVLRPPAVGYAPQVPHLFGGTIRDNIVLGRDVPTDAVSSAVLDAQLGHDLALMPLGLDTVVGSGGATLSGGQAQRIALARALVTFPNLLVVDDLASAVDATTARATVDALVADTQRAVLVVTNRDEVLRRATHVIVLGEGRVQAEGTYGALQKAGILITSSRESADDASTRA